MEIAGAMTEAGGHSLVLTRGGRMEADLARAGGTLMRFPAATKNPARVIANAFRIAAIAREHGAALIHARSRAPAWSALIAARRAGLPFVTTYHGAYNEAGPVKRLYNSVMARADLVIANSRYTADLVRTRYGTPNERLRVVHRGVDMARFDPGAVEPARVSSLRDAWGLKDGDRAILHPARLTSWKGQTTVIAAAAKLMSAGRLGDLVIILAGDAQGREAYRSTLQARIANAGLGDRVRLVGHVSDMPAAFLAADGALVASTDPEAFGRTATEAQAMGCPVIATNIGAPPETVVPESAGREAMTGWLVPPGDAAALAEALGALHALGAEDKAAMAARARQRVEELFSLRSMKKLTLAVYDELLQTRLVETFNANNRS